MKNSKYITLGLLAACSNIVAEEVKPNLVFIMCDELTFRTLGCYRNLLTDDLAYPWGDGIKVETPNIDRIAREGLLHNKLYPTCPVSGPSRATLFTGMYPDAVGCPKNEMPMNDGTKTLGTELLAAGYKNSYIGKWHLNGTGAPEWGVPRPFGFTDNQYMFNDGHWPWLKLKADSVTLLGQAQSSNLSAMPYSKDGAAGYTVYYTTDFLTNKALLALERDKEGPFCMVLSIPNPHTPRVSRADYLAPFQNLNFTNPKTGEIPNILRPKWSIDTGGNEVKEFVPQEVKEYFGAVKNIDDNVGRILKFLDDNGLTNNTIVVFTADHGDMLYEHKREDKNMPFDAAARVPFLVRYPGIIPAGKIISTATTNANVVPSLLEIMGVAPIVGTHGTSDAADFTSTDLTVDANRIIYSRGYSGFNAFIMDNRYKLALSNVEEPFLIDLQKDPDEVVNYFNDPTYNNIVTTFIAEGRRQMTNFADPVINTCFNKVPTSLPVPMTPVTGVNIDTTRYSLPINAIDYVFTIIAPLNASDPSVTWTSSNPGVATVESSGVIAGLVKTKAVGVTTISANTIDGGYHDSYQLTVGSLLTRSIDAKLIMNGIKIFPNPFIDKFIIKLPENQSYNSLQIIDMIGRILFKQNIKGQNNITVNSADFSSSTTGLYLLKLVSDKNSTIYKLQNKKS
ncbi:MAG: sulfatase-like hydrolase/transferase [Bacteroidales bacterium]